MQNSKSNHDILSSFVCVNSSRRINLPLPYKAKSNFNNLDVKDFENTYNRKDSAISSKILNSKMTSFNSNGKKRQNKKSKEFKVVGGVNHILSNVLNVNCLSSNTKSSPTFQKQRQKTKHFNYCFGSNNIGNLNINNFFSNLTNTSKGNNNNSNSHFDISNKSKKKMGFM